MSAAADVRQGGAWTRGQRVKNDMLYVLAMAVIAGTSRLPRAVLRAFGAGLGALAWAIVPSARRMAIANVKRAMPETADPRGLARRSFGVLGRHLGEALAMLAPGRALELLAFAPGSREILDAARAEGHGVLFASAHLGPWERVAASIVAAGVPMTVVAREAYDPRLTRMYERLRGGNGVRAVFRGAPGAATGLLRTLRRGEVLGIPMDLASRVPSVEVAFLGHLAQTPVGPARIALRTGAAVVVGTYGREGIEVTRLRTHGETDTSLTARINDELSARIRALPEAWVWMHPRWDPFAI